MSRHYWVFGLAVALWILAGFIGSIALAVGVGVALSVVIGLGVAFPNWKMFGPYICLGSTKRKWVALTFDDGPDPRSTPALLEVLKAAQISATFFCIGRKVTEQPELTARIAREGHQVENHTYFHSNATNFYTTAHLHEELMQTQAAVEKAVGSSPRLFRPPMGLSNPRIFRAARGMGLKVIGWTARGLDTKLTESARIVARLEKGFKPGAILLLHDGNIPAERLVTTVKILLDKLRNAGYEVVRLDQILE